MVRMPSIMEASPCSDSGGDLLSPPRRGMIDCALVGPHHGGDLGLIGAERHRHQIQHEAKVFAVVLLHFRTIKGRLVVANSA